MDITPTVTTTTTTTTNTNTASTKSPEADSETPTRIHKPLAFSNGILKRHNPHHHHHLHLLSAPVVVTYKECQKNHAASLGGHALDGCGEFMPSPTSTPTDPTSLKCAACGCHRNFHRREPEEPLPATNTAHVIEYQPHHRHHPPPPPPPLGGNRSPSSSSPPPISSSYYPSAPHMLLALSTGLSGPQQDNVGAGGGSSRKRYRSKFSQDQKEKMHRFAERVGWKMQKRDEEIVQAFCNEIGVEKGILKVWMHNNKNTFGKKDVNGSPGRNVVEQIHNNGNKNEINNTTTTAAATATAITTTTTTNNNDQDDDDNHHNSHGGAHVATNGSSSSS